MAVYFALAAIIGLYGTAIHANTDQGRRKRFVIVAFALMILLAGLRSPNVGIDIPNHYAKNFVRIASFSLTDVPKFSAMGNYEIGYCYYTWFLNLISHEVQVYIFITELLIYSAIGYFIYKESTDVVMSTELVIFSCLYYMCMNIMRQGLAVAIILVGYVWLDYSNRRIKDYIKYVILIFLASTFHSSAILCLLMIVFDRLKFTRKQIIGGGVITVLLYEFYMQIYVGILGILGSSNYERYLTGSESMGNMNMQSIFNFILTVGAFAIGYYVLVWKKKTVKTLLIDDKNGYQLQKNESFMLFMVLMASVCRLLLFRMNIINRFTYYFIPYVLVLYPYAIDSMHLKSNRTIVRILVYGLFFIYFLWMTTTYAASFYGAVPYSFYWQ